MSITTADETNPEKHHRKPTHVGTSTLQFRKCQNMKSVIRNGLEVWFLKPDRFICFCDGAYHLKSGTDLSSPQLEHARHPIHVVGWRHDELWERSTRQRGR